MSRDISNVLSAYITNFGSKRVPVVNADPIDEYVSMVCGSVKASVFSTQEEHNAALDDIQKRLLAGVIFADGLAFTVLDDAPVLLIAVVGKHAGHADKLIEAFKWITPPPPESKRGAAKARYDMSRAEGDIIGQDNWIRPLSMLMDKFMLRPAPQSPMQSLKIMYHPFFFRDGAVGATTISTKCKRNGKWSKANYSVYDVYSFRSTSTGWTDFIQRLTDAANKDPENLFKPRKITA